MDLAESASTKDAADARLRFEVAMAYAAMGDVSAGPVRAGIRLTSGGQDDSARMWYQRSLEVFKELEHLRQHHERPK